MGVADRRARPTRWRRAVHAFMRTLDKRDVVEGFLAMDPLSPDLIQQYQDRGVLILRGVFTQAEIAAVSAETQALLERKDLMDSHNLRVRWQYHFETGDPVFELFDPIVDLAPRCSELALAPRVTQTLATLLGEPVHLFKDKLIYKPAGAGGYPLHQDFIAWPGFPETFTTVVIAIDGASVENGCIEVFPGQHKRGCLSDRDGNFHILSEEQMADAAPLGLDLNPGDIAIYGCFMPHRSTFNRTNSSRRHLLLSYNADSDGGPQRDAHYQAFHHYLRGIYSMMGMGDLFFK
jgi:hypothetical protein